MSIPNPISSRKTYFLLLFFFFTSISSFTQGRGEIMFVGFNSDGDDGFAIATLVDLSPNTVIYFNDNEWNGLAIGSGGAFTSNTETELTWNTGASTIPEGTVVVFTETNNASNTNYGASHGSLTGTLSLSGTNEVIYAFLGTDDETPTQFLTAISNSSFNVTNGQLTNTGLKDSVQAVSVTGNEDVMVFNGSIECDTVITVCNRNIADPSAWDTEDGSGRQDNNGIYPDFPDDLPASTGGLLPVELISFNVQENEDEQVLINWTTASEINNDFVTVEYSENGFSWEALAIVDGAGNSTEVLNYQYIHTNPSNRINYYRVKQTDFDGTFTYSNISSIIFDKIYDLRLFPNPVQTELTLEMDKVQLQRESIIIVNNLGHRIPFISNQLSDNQIKIDVSAFQAGIYRIVLNNSQNIFSKTFIVQ